MHPSIFSPLNPHMMLHLTIFLAKPMFRVNKSLLILKQTRHVMWQNILWLVLEYFSMSHNISMWQTNILRIFYDIAWNIFKDSILFICSPTSIIAHYSSYKWGFKSSFVHLLTSLCIIVVINKVSRVSCVLQWSCVEKVKLVITH
jgi:hypothetical protein